MPEVEPRGRWCVLAGFASFALAFVPALMVFFFLEKVPTMAIPVVASGLPLIARTRRQAYRLAVVGLIVLSLIVILGWMGVGRLFIPSALAMVLACKCARH